MELVRRISLYASVGFLFGPIVILLVVLAGGVRADNTFPLMLLAAMGGAFVGGVIAYGNELERAPRDEELAAMCATLKLNSLEVVSESRIQGYYALPFFQRRMSHPLRHILGGRAGEREFFLMYFHPPSNQAMNLMVRNPFSPDIEGPEKAVFFPKGGGELPHFQLVLKKEGWSGLFVASGDSHKRFLTFYHFLANGHPVNLALIRDEVVPEALLALLAERHDWSCEVHDGHLFLWQVAKEGFRASKLTATLSGALETQAVLAEATNLRKDKGCTET